MSDFLPVIDKGSGIPKFLQLVNSFEDAVKSKVLNVGDSLPSVNELCGKLELSRDTVFKAYSELKNRKLIESVPNKGYYVSSNVHNVFLFLDTFKAYKEVLYGAFREALPSRINVDVHFHHYNPRIFEDIIRASAGKYSHYVIMNFNDKKVKEALSNIDPTKLLCIDWKVNVPAKSSFIGQDFSQPVYDNLVKIKDKLNKYKRFIFIYPEFTNHPQESIKAFERFCKDYKQNYKVLYSINDLNIQKNELYLTVSDRVLAKLLDEIHDNGLILGDDIGIISYNETPTKKYIKDGITVISTDFDEIGKKMARFILENKPLKEFIPTQIIERKSI